VIINQFALGGEGENLFALFWREKFGTKNPPAFSAGTPTKEPNLHQICIK